MWKGDPTVIAAHALLAVRFAIALPSLGARFLSIRKKKSSRRLVKETVSWQLGTEQGQQYF